MYRSWLRRALALLIVLGPNIGLSEPSFPPRDALSPSKKKASGAARDVDELVISNRSGRRGSITFKPITKERLIELAESALQSGARGKKNKKVKDFLDVLRSDQPITAPSDGSKEGARGKDAKPAKISQKRYFKELNQLERRANQLGFSLLDNPGQDEVFESRFATDSASFKAQAQSARDQAVPGASPLKFPKRPLFSDIKVKSGARGGQSHLRLLPKERIYTVGAKSTGGARGGAKAAREYKPKKTSRSAKFGSKKLARASIDHWLQPKASEDALRVQTETAVNIHLFGVKASIAKATADFRVDTQKERVSGKVTAFVLGKEKVLLNQSKVKVTHGSTFQKGDRWSREDSTSTKIRFQLGPVPCTVEVGAAFRAGIEYRVAMTPAAISMETIPYVNADAFARFAVDIFVASAGIRGDVVLIDGELRTVGELGLAKDGKDKLIVYSFFSGERGLETLSGSLSAFVKVGVGWFSKTFKHKIFGWKGFRQAQQLYKIQKSKIRLKRTKEVTRWVNENEPRAKVNRSPVQATEEMGKTGGHRHLSTRFTCIRCPPEDYAQTR